MRFNRYRKRRKINKAAVNMSSMIDVTFLLLVYFLVTTVLTPPEDELSPALQTEEGASSEQYELDPQIIQVSSEGDVQIYKVGNRLVPDRHSLGELLAQLPHEPGLIVKVDGSTDVAFAIAAIQEARDAGFERVTYVPSSP